MSAYACSAMRLDTYDYLDDESGSYVKGDASDVATAPRRSNLFTLPRNMLNPTRQC